METLEKLLHHVKTLNALPAFEKKQTFGGGGGPNLLTSIILDGAAGLKAYLSQKGCWYGGSEFHSKADAIKRYNFYDTQRLDGKDIFVRNGSGPYDHLHVSTDCFFAIREIEGKQPKYYTFLKAEKLFEKQKQRMYDEQ